MEASVPEDQHLSFDCNYGSAAQSSERKKEERNGKKMEKGGFEAKAVWCENPEQHSSSSPLPSRYLLSDLYVQVQAQCMEKQATCGSPSLLSSVHVNVVLPILSPFPFVLVQACLPLDSLLPLSLLCPCHKGLCGLTPRLLRQLLYHCVQLRGGIC